MSRLDGAEWAHPASREEKHKKQNMDGELGGYDTGSVQTAEGRLGPGSHQGRRSVVMRVGADPVMPLEGRATKILINTGFLLLDVVFLSTKITHMTGKGVQIVKVNK